MAFVVSYVGYAEDVKVYRTVDRAMAKAVAADMPSNRTAFALENAADVSSIALTGALVLKLYNALADSPVSKFENRQVGHERLIRLLEAKFGTIDVTTTELPDAGAVPATETQHDSDPAQSGPTMEEGAEDMAAKKKKAAKAAKSGGGGRTRKNADAKITLLAKENPKRAGSESYKRFNKYKTGMTVGEALKAGLTGADLTYDAKHGYIEIAG